ncbi:MAG: tetratricopeptide repeat protein, partial [Opitutales bacterium]
DWEAFWLFYRMTGLYPEHKNAEDILYLAYSLAHKLGSHAMMEDLARRYLENMEYLEYRGTVATQLGEYYVSQENFEKLYQLTEDYLELAPPDDPGSQIILFTHGMMRLGRHEISELLSDFTRYELAYGDTSAGTVINYFLGLGYLLEQEHQQSIDYLDKVIEKSMTKFKPDAVFRKALALIGLDEVQQARRQLEGFISSYPDNPLRATAEFTLGSVVDMLGERNQALKHYRRVAEHIDDAGLIGGAEVKIARILGFQGKADEAIKRLQAYLDKYGESPDSIPASEELANLLNKEDRAREALVILEEQVNRFIGEIRVGEIDPMLVTYIKQDRRLREVREKTEEFFRIVSSDAELLEELVKDRAAQFRYFKEHDAIDVAVQDAFVYDNEFRASILERLDELRPPPPPMPAAPEPGEGPPPPPPPPKPINLEDVTIQALADLQDSIKEANKRIPPKTVDERLHATIERAKASGNIPLVTRIETAFALTETPAKRPEGRHTALIEEPGIWSELAHASHMWILEEITRYDPDRVIEELTALRPQLMSTNSELPMYQILAKCYEETGSKELALGSHQEIIKRFSSKNEAANATLEAGRLLIELGREKEARETLQEVLYRPDWLGAKHAQALLWIGRAYNAEDRHEQAHGFFERVMLGYPGQTEEVAEAYYEDIKTLKRMGESASVETVYEAFLETPGLQDTKAGKKIKEEFNL